MNIRILFILLFIHIYRDAIKDVPSPFSSSSDYGLRLDNNGGLLCGILF